MADRVCPTTPPSLPAPFGSGYHLPRRLRDRHEASTEPQLHALSLHISIYHIYQFPIGMPARYKSVEVRPCGKWTVRNTSPPGFSNWPGMWPCSASSMLSCQMGPAPSTPVTLIIGESSLFPAHTPIT